jgi:diadenosine tetraphosphate (Ap4A) HIT family hydrolase
LTSWQDLKEWNALRSGKECPICRQGVPRDLLAELEASWVTFGEQAPMRGYTCLVFRRHAVELHDLSEIEGATFMHDVRRVSRAVAEATGAIKLNYEIHGNTVPHLHMHFFPRYIGDPFEGRPIDPRPVATSPYAPGEFRAMRERLANILRVNAG